MINNSIKKLIYKTLIGLILCILMLFALIRPDFYISTALQGLLLWATNLLPALFPFFVFTKIIVEMNILKPLSRVISPIMKLFFNTGKNSGYLFFISILCGYPVGSKMIADAYKLGQIDYVELHRLTACTSVSGPLFIVGTVGITMLSNATIGYIILCAQILSIILNGILFRYYTPKAHQKHIAETVNSSNENLLVGAIKNSIDSILLIGGLVTVFFVGIEVINSLIPLPALTQGMIELTKGCYEIANFGYPIVISACLCSGIIAFGGFCIHAQSYYFLSSTGLTYSYFLTTKFTQMIISVMITYILCFILL